MKILLIDESDFSKDKLSPKLHALGYSVDRVISYKMLQETLHENIRYDVIWVNRNLPEESHGEPKEIGFDVAKEMRKKFSLAQIVLFDSEERGSIKQTGDDFFKTINKKLSVQDILQDIQAVGRSAVERKLDFAQKQLRQISKITTALIGEKSEKKVYGTIIKGVAALGFDRARLYLLNKDGVLHGAAQWGLSDKVAHSDRFFEAGWKCHFFDLNTKGKKLHEPQIFRQGEEDTLEDYETRMGRSGLSEWAIVPLISGGNILGRLTIDNLHSGRKIFENELPALKGLASQAAVAIDNLKTKEKEAWKTRQLQVIHDVTSTINQLSDLKDVYQAVSKAVVELFDTVDHSGLVIFEQDYRFGRVVSEFPELLGNTDPIKISIRDIPFEEKLLGGADHITSFDVINDDSLGEIKALLTGVGIQSLVIIPLRYHNRLLGSLTLDATKNKHRFSQEEIEMAQTFAAHVSAAIVNSQRLSELTALNACSEALSKITDLDTLLEEIVMHAVAFVKGKNGGIYLLDESQKVFLMTADAKRKGKEITIPIDMGMVGYMYRENLPYLMTNNYKKESYRYPAFCDEDGTNVLLIVTLMHKQKTIGYLYVEDQLGRIFNQQDVKRLSSLASLAGSAIKQSQLLNNQKYLSQQLQVLHDFGDVIESADDFSTVTNFSLMALTAEYALGYDRAAYFIIDSKDPTILCGRAAHGYLSHGENSRHKQDLQDRGLTNRKSHAAAYRADELEIPPLNTLVRNIRIDLKAPDSAVFVELLESKTTWFHVDQNKNYVSKMPQQVQDIFMVEGPTIIVPMIVANQKVGILFVDNPFSRKTSDYARLKALKTFATSTANALLRIRVAKEERQKAQNLQLLSQISQKAAGLQNMQESLELIINTLRDISGADNVAFIQINLDDLDQERKHLWSPKVIYAVRPVDSPKHWMRPNGASVNVLKSGRPKVIQDLDIATTKDFNDAKKTLNMKSVACFPAIASDRELGVVWFYFFTPQEFNSKDQLDLWQLFVNQVATLYQLRSDYEKLASEIRLNEAMQQMVVTKDLDGVYDHIVRHARFALSKQEKRLNIALYGYDAERKQLTHMAHDFLNVSYADLQSNKVEKLRLVEEVLAQGKITSFSLHPHTIETEPLSEVFDWKVLLPAKGAQAVSLVPISWREHNLAIMAVSYLAPQSFSKSQTRSLKRLARFAGVALHNANELKAKDMQVGRFAALSTINQFIVEGGSVQGDAFLNLITAELYKFMQRQARPVLFCDLRLRDGDWLNVRSVYPLKYQTHLKPINLKGENKRIGITGSAFLSKVVVPSFEVSDGHRYSFEIAETKSELAVPIMVRDHAIGVLNIEFSEINGFTNSDIELIEAFASRIALLMVRSHKIRQQEAFHRASTIIANSVTDDVEKQTMQILEQAVKVLSPLNGAKPTLAILSLSDDNRAFHVANIYPVDRFRKWVGQENASMLKADPQRIGLMRRVQLTGKPQISNDVSKNPDYIEINPTTRSEMAVPLIENGTVIGSLSVESEQLNAYMQEDLDALNTFAQLVTIMLKNGRQYSELMDVRTQVEAVTALSWMTMITGVWQHANKGRAVTIKDRAKLIELDLADKNYADIGRHVKVIETAAHEILNRKMRTSLADKNASEPEQLSKYIHDFVTWKINHLRNTNIKLKTELDEDKGYVVRLQKEWFLELLDIVFNNARQATEKSKYPEITIALHVKRPQKTITVAISDNGPGFSEKLREELFTKVIEKPADETGGGVGLLMAKLITESFSGKIAASNTSKGARIEMSFPMEQGT